jgi:hypothetical protein
MHHFATLSLRNSGIYLLAGALTLFGCTIHSTTHNHPGDEKPASSGGEKDKPEKDKPKKDKPKKDKPKADKPVAKPDNDKALEGLTGLALRPAKPDKPKEDKPAVKPDKPKEDKPAAKPDKPKEDKPAAKPDKPEPLPERSKIVLPVRIALAAIDKQINELVPTTDSKDWQQVTKGESSPKADLKYELWREPIDVKLDGSTFHIAVPVRYAATIRAQAKNPLNGDWFWIAKSETWGTRNEPQRITAHFEAKLDIDDEWRVKSDIKLVKIEHGEVPSGNICKNIGIDVCVTKASVAGEVREGIDKRLEEKVRKALGKLDGKLERSFDLKRRAEKVWSQVQQPQSVPGTPDSVWLVVRPSAVGVGRVRQDGSDVRVDLAVEGKLSVVAGDKPKVKVEPLPKITKVDGDAGFYVIADLRIPQEVLGKTLEQRLRGLSFSSKKNEKIEVVQANVVARTNEQNPRRISVKISFGDKPEDALELEGELVYDANSQRLSVKNFDFMAASGGVLANKLAAFDHAAIRRQIEAKASWDLSNEAGSLKKGISAALAASLRGQANVGGSLEKLEVRDFAVKKGAVEAKVIVGGQLEVSVPAPK